MNDAVDVVDGPLKGRSGTVKYIMRGFLFIQVRSCLSLHGVGEQPSQLIRLP